MLCKWIINWLKYKLYNIFIFKSTTATVNALITTITTITKGCQASCTATSASLLGSGGSTSCCTTDLCNESTKAISSLKMIPALLLSFLIFKLFWKLILNY